MGTDLVISTPKAEASKLAEEILKLEATQEMDRWNGPASERHHRTGRFLRDNIDQLESRLRQLTIKYLDDAPEVVRTREALERSRKALDSLRPIPVDREAIRVFVGKYSPGAGRSS